MPICNNKCPYELNKLLVPIFLESKNHKEICSYIEKDCKETKIFIAQVLRFLYKLRLAKQYTADRKCFCPTKIEWKVSSSPLIISQKLMSKYFDFVFCNNTYFAFIFRKVLEIVYRNKICKQMIQDGKECCKKCCKK